MSNNHKADLFFCLFVLEVWLSANIKLIPATQQNDFVFLNDHHDKSSYDLSPY